MTRLIDQSGRAESGNHHVAVELDGSFLNDPVAATGVKWSVERTPLHGDSDAHFKESLTLEGVVSDEVANALEQSYRKKGELQLVSPMTAPPMDVTSLHLDDAGHGRTWVSAELVEVV